MKFETRAVHTGVRKDGLYNSVTTPIYPTSTFFWNDVETHSGYEYTRSGNPVRQIPDRSRPVVLLRADDGPAERGGRHHAADQSHLD